MNFKESIVCERYKHFVFCRKSLVRLLNKNFKEEYSKTLPNDVAISNIIKYNISPANEILNPNEAFNLSRYLYSTESYYNYLDICLLTCIDYFDPILDYYRKGSIDDEYFQFACGQMNIISPTTGYKVYDNDFKLDFIEQSIKENRELMNSLNEEFYSGVKRGSCWTAAEDIWIVYTNQVYNVAYYLWMVSQIEPLEETENVKELKTKYERIMKG